MNPLRTLLVPRMIRLKAGALGRLPIYLRREGWNRVLAVVSDGLPASLQETLKTARFERVVSAGEGSVCWLETVETTGFDAVCGLGGGKALDLAKLLAHRADLPYMAVPTSLSNDGFCSPQASLLQAGRKTSIAGGCRTS